MQKRNVLVLVPVEESDMKSIASVDSSIEAIYGMEEIRAEQEMDPMLPPPLENPIRKQRLTCDEGRTALDRLLETAEIIFCWRLPSDLLARAPRLKWIQASGAGFDILDKVAGLRESNIMLTHASGNFRAVPVAEYALCVMLMLAKKAMRFIENKKTRHWEPFVKCQLKGKVLGIVGLGRIGKEIAKRAKSFDMKVLATKWSAQHRLKDVEGVDELLPANELHHMLAESDYVVLTLPLTDRNRGLIGEKELRLMKSTSYLINVARGAIVQQNVLTTALKEGWITGAALDVFETEPLPSESELWDLPNVILTPHTAGHSENHSTFLTEFFCENLRRYIAGNQMISVVDKTKGY